MWINGPFGVGKTQTAHALRRRMPGSFICDPEQLGFGIQRMTPPGLRGDFQDVPPWREGVYRMLDRNLGLSQGVTLVPMTLVNPVYFGEIVGRLRENGHTVHHVALMASRDTLLRRLRSRGEGPGSWGARQIDRCLAGLAQIDPAEHLDTEHLTNEEVVEEVARRAGLSLEPDRVPRLLRPLERLAVQIGHLRGDG